MAARRAVDGRDFCRFVDRQRAEGGRRSPSMRSCIAPAHVIEFAMLGWLLLRAIGDGRAITRREMVIALIVIALYGASDEFHQRFTPGRSSELSAVLFDTAGGLIGAWLWRWRAKRRVSESANH